MTAVRLDFFLSSFLVFVGGSSSASDFFLILTEVSDFLEVGFLAAAISVALFSLILFVTALGIIDETFFKGRLLDFLRSTDPIFRSRLLLLFVMSLGFLTGEFFSPLSDVTEPKRNKVSISFQEKQIRLRIFFKRLHIVNSFREKNIYISLVFIKLISTLVHPKMN